MTIGFIFWLLMLLWLLFGLWSNWPSDNSANSFKPMGGNLLLFILLFLLGWRCFGFIIQG